MAPPKSVGKRPIEVVDLTGDDGPPQPKRVAPSAAPRSLVRSYSSASSDWKPSGSQLSSSQPSSSSIPPRHPGSLSQPLVLDDPDDLSVLDLAVDDELSAWEFIGNLDIKIVGVRFYDGRVTPGEVAICHRELNNMYDANAIRVDNVLGDQIGHIPRGVAEKLAPYLDRKQVIVEAKINGEKGAYECPVRISFYGLGGATARVELQKRLKADKLLKPSGLTESRKETGTGRAVTGLKSGQSTAGLGGVEEVSLDDLLRQSENANFRVSGDAIKTLALSEEELAKMPKAEQPAGLEAQLLTYQLQGLAWLKAKESPCLPAPGSEDAVQLWKHKIDGSYYNIATNYHTSRKPELFSGGILADDMGLGKTLQIISLIITGGPGPTLIVAPVSVLSNWEQQIERHVKSSRRIRILTYYGAKNEGESAIGLSNYDIVITSYGKLKSQSSLLQKVNWRRVVLDEGHIIRNAKTQMAEAACELKAQSRWVLSGTPIINSVADLHSLLKFLGIKGGVENPQTFSSVITKPLRHGSPNAEALLQALVKDICLRRKKDMKFVALTLPTKEEFIHKISFHRKEQVRYDALLQAARGSLKKALGRAARKKGERLDAGKLPNVLELLLRLRQMCNHWALCKQSVEDVLELLASDGVVEFTDKNRALLQKALQLYIESQEECPVCIDSLTNPVITNCKHVFCKECITKVVDVQKKCPMCRNQLELKSLLELEPEKSGEDEVGDFDTETRSSKTEALLRILQATLKDKGSKVVVFSQWTSFLNIIQAQLEESGYKFVRLDGSMPKAKRDAAVSALDNDPDTRILLASLAVCSVGLNLVAADTVVLADSWWAPAIEDQAVDRVHRIGQKRQTKIWRLVMENSVEDRVLSVQEEKRKLVSQAFQEKDKSKKSRETRLGDILRLLG